MASAKLLEGRRFVPAAPLSALFAAAIATIVVAAETGLAFCSRRVALPIPICGGQYLHALPTLRTIAPSHQFSPLEVCPIVLGLVVAAFGLTAYAIMALARDRHARLALKLFLRALSRLRIETAAIRLTAGSLVPITLMFAGVPGSLTAITLLALMGTIFILALAISLLAKTAARVLIGLATRTVITLLEALGSADVPRLRLHVPRRWDIRRQDDVAVLAIGRGLRAPPCHG